MNEKILVVEDEAAIRELIAVNLRHAGFQVIEAPDAKVARSMLELESPDLVVLDWMLPDTPGIDLARSIRAGSSHNDVPVIMLTARAQEGDKLTGFEAGIDDYLTKPFSPRELVARVKAMLRRLPSDDARPAQTTLTIGSLRVDLAAHRAFAGESPVSLSPTEFKLLACLMQAPDRVLSRSQLLDDVWGNSSAIEERTVDVHIRRLRLALRASGLDKQIETVRSGGYRFNPADKHTDKRST